MEPLASVYSPEQVESAQLLVDTLTGLSFLAFAVGTFVPVVVMIYTGSLWRTWVVAWAALLPAYFSNPFTVALVNQIWPGMPGKLDNVDGGPRGVITGELLILLCWPFMVFLVIIPFRKLFIAVQNRMRLHRKPAQ